MATIVDSYSESNQSSFGVVGLAASGLQSAFGQSFTGDGGVIDYVTLYLKDWNSPTGNLIVEIYAHSGTYGTSGVPTGSVLATSDNFDVSAVGSSFALHNITFSGTNKITLTDGTYYVLVVRFSGADSSNGISIGLDDTSPTASGNFSYEYNSGTLWGGNNTTDFCFYVYKDRETITHSPGTMANDSSYGNYAWTNVDNVKTSDNTYATSVVEWTDITQYLKATNFGFNISSGSTINGVLVEVERKRSGVGVSQDAIIKLVKGGSISGDDKEDSDTAWPSSDAYASYGGIDDLWGNTLTPADVNASDFGVVALAQILGPEGDTTTAYVDHIQITVYYTGSLTYSKSFGIDGRVLSKATKSFTVDGIVLIEQTESVTVDAIVSEINSLSFTTSGLVKSIFNEQFTLDGVLVGRGEQALTVNAIVGPLYYYLSNKIIPRPKSLIRESVFSKTDITTIDGKTSRDTGTEKEKYMLTWEIISKEEMDNLVEIVELNTAVLFGVNDGNLVINEVNVIPFMNTRSYTLVGNNYIGTTSLELIVETGEYVS